MQDESSLRRKLTSLMKNSSSPSSGEELLGSSVSSSFSLQHSGSSRSLFRWPELAWDSPVLASSVLHSTSRSEEVTNVNLLLVRVKFGDDSTLGKLFLTNSQGRVGQFLCYTLEDEVRAEKVKGETAIWEGNYEILPRAEGGMHPKYQGRYGDVHVGMAHLQSVRGFKWVYIHTGNTDDHTDGCILVGQLSRPLDGGNFKLVDSRAAYLPLYKLMATAWGQGETVRITVTGQYPEQA